jgi:uncharacterized membrane protein
MLRTVKFVVAMSVFLVLYITTVAPAIESVSSSIQSVNGNTGPLSMWGSVETALFVGLPLVMLGGIILVGFIVAVGLRGTSFQ